MNRRPNRYITFIIIAIFLSSLLYVVSAFSDAGEEKKEVVVKSIVSFLKEQKVKMSDRKLKEMANTIYEEARANDVDYRLILAIIKVESNFSPKATSRDGAKGLMQIKPSLARLISKEKGIDLKHPRHLNEPEKNIKIGTYHISRLLDAFDNIHSALHAYNAGPKKAKNRIEKDIDSETAFSRKVLREYGEYMAVLPDPAD
ncbi:MAG: lytic transglycosylase domain-containing protein [Syntrophorhabdaceae bacterium]|nr:lytic transglycosylase domain-containing protein [Syntrophorhabdaceae bacterium]